MILRSFATSSTMPLMLLASFQLSSLIRLFASLTIISHRWLRLIRQMNVSAKSRLSFSSPHIVVSVCSSTEAHPIQRRPDFSQCRGSRLKPCLAQFVLRRGARRTIIRHMTEFSTEEQQRRDKLLLDLLKTPPQPRPKRDRGKSPTREGDEPNNEGTPEPSA